MANQKVRAEGRDYLLAGAEGSVAHRPVQHICHRFNATPALGLRAAGFVHVFRRATALFNGTGHLCVGQRVADANIHGELSSLLNCE